MSDERRSRRERSTQQQQQQKGIFSRMFNADEAGDETTVYSQGGMGKSGRSRDERQGFTVELAAEIIKELPPEVPRQSAYRIVRQTLLATGIDIESLGSSTRARESKLGSEIELSQQRIQDLENRTREVISSLEDQIRKARDARDYGVREEEERISRARESLEDIGKVREFFGLSEEASAGETSDAPDDATGDSTEDFTGDETQVMERVDQDVDQDDTQIMRPRGPLSREWESGRDREDRDS